MTDQEHHVVEGESEHAKEAADSVADSSDRENVGCNPPRILRPVSHDLLSLQEDTSGDTANSALG